MRNFGKGFLVGVFATVGCAAGALFSFKKTVVDPIEDQENRYEENRKRALRKSRSAHQG
ncbi:DUF3042 family protein [Nicoliella spurrieriana]|uniref:DUF3042 family protein n=1 Tax=Nicoliella spurrieriana TaxID=2925830 RepID=A0A976RRR2_9LACO|nr:DUF3042 family protein [Nicoliella spurrieriana]UQS86675.1 DUF3042 family protein [Nicoliella spurrieriana]